MDQTHTAPSCTAKRGSMALLMGPIMFNSDTPQSWSGCQSPRSVRMCLPPGPSAQWLSNLIQNVIQLAPPPLTPATIWGLLEQPWAQWSSPSQGQGRISL